ncbi:response regulator [Deinococcus peraridilitoris]|uniref:CheY-like receiver domain-containing protein n=1 Tax=Deinococcus peraridilitoris (strain DSM 19664 / LMG 22246 / CIP 109416 / KR-200) TaxID=937777 RepID=K9ZXP9_DEIPD|nr:response regulator [Deinococcus peraridilitoris]AFZ65677.1 CheY-like receiver domain-containing protein [Deinococcus peraridilitoris DSM 19664]
MPIRKRILLVDDNPADLEIAAQAFGLAGITLLDTAHSLEEALEYLQRRGRHSERRTADPTLILLDLNMPGGSGLDLLRHIKSDPLFSLTPVVMLTTSSASSDIEACYRHGANGYVVKPSRFSDFQEVVLSLKSFWLSFNRTATPTSPQNTKWWL